MKVSLVITVFNEEKTIQRLLDSLSIQTRKPDELIIVDGGSSDGTVEKIKKPPFEESIRLPRRGVGKLRLVVEKGASIAQGRNLGIKMAKYPIIAMTDAGCVIHKDWLEKITQPFKLTRPGLSGTKGQALSAPDIVAGFYQMTGKSIFQKCLACYLGILPEKLDPDNFLPSTRSIAFKKEIWEKIGGFDERLDRAGEDTLFNYQAKKMGAQFVTAIDALVDWEAPKTWQEAVKKFYHYAKGDGQIGIWWHPQKRLASHNIKTAMIFIRYLVVLIMAFFLSAKLIYCFIAILLYCCWAVIKNYRYVRRWQAVFVLPALQIVSDLVVMGGFVSGISFSGLKVRNFLFF